MDNVQLTGLNWEPGEKATFLWGNGGNKDCHFRRYQKCRFFILFCVLPLILIFVCVLRGSC